MTALQTPPSNSAFRLPPDDKHTAIVGRNGTGKTQGGIWQLSLRSYPTKPWTIVNFKGDRLINSIPGATFYDFNKKPPERPGIYIINPVPRYDSDAVNEYLWRVWEQENHGVFIDEGYMMNENDEAFIAILTQGRSKHVPLIVLSQRPRWLTAMAWSEAGFYQCYALNILDDIKRVREWCRTYPDEPNTALPKFASIWYDVDENYSTRLNPVPNEAKILATFRDRMPPKRGFFSLSR